MKRLRYFVAATLLLIVGCRKDEIEIEPLATVSVVNAVIDGKVTRLNSNLRDSCLNMAFKHFTILAGNASPIKAYPSGLSNIIYANQSPNSQAGDIYSLFLTGTHAAPESVLVKDKIPPYPSEEVINVRLINLSPGSVPIGLTLGDQPTVPVFSGIAYKQVSEFKTLSFPMTLPANRHLFQIRDSAGNLLFTYTMPATGTVSRASSRKRNITIAYKGMSGGTGTKAIGVVVLPHY